MNKLYIFTLLALFASLRMLAQDASSFIYGYQAEGITLNDTLVSGNIKTATISGFSNAKHTGNHYALLEMPANVSNTMSGCQITEVSFYPFMTSKSEARIVISNTIGGTPLYEQVVTGIESKKWQTVTLTTPFTINADEHLFIGYIIESAAGDYPVGYYYTSNPAAAAVIDPILDYIAYEESGEIKSGLLDTQMYAARRQTANLMLYAKITNPDGEMPKNGVAVGKLSLSEGCYVKPNAKQKLSFVLNNTATEPLSSFDIRITNGENVLFSQTFTPAKALVPMEEGQYSVQMPTDAVGLQKINVYIDNPNGKSNAFKGEKNAKINYLVYDETMKRNVVLEHFTTGQCTNCVAGEEKVEQELAKVDGDINVIRINHHSGFGTDKLTQPDDVAYEWFYGGSYVWAPANMIDRTDLEAYGAKGYGGTATVGPVFGTDKSEPISALITSAAGIPAFVSIDIDCVEVSDHQVSITVNAKQLYEMPQADIMRLNVAVVQDGVKAVQLLSDRTVDKNFIHYNVFRKNLTGTWGEEVEFVDYKLEKSFTYDAPASYTMDNLRVIAFLADYDATNTKNCRIYNAAEKKVETLTGIKEITAAGNNIQTSVYNIAGQKVAPDYKGIVIKNGKKVKQSPR